MGSRKADQYTTTHCVFLFRHAFIKDRDILAKEKSDFRLENSNNFPIVRYAVTGTSKLYIHVYMYTWEWSKFMNNYALRGFDRPTELTERRWRRAYSVTHRRSLVVYLMLSGSKAVAQRPPSH